MKAAALLRMREAGMRCARSAEFRVGARDSPLAHRLSIEHVLDEEGELKSSVILGFTRDGRHLLAYSSATGSCVLCWWAFACGRRATRVASVTLFDMDDEGDAMGSSELFLRVIESGDGECVVVVCFWGLVSPSQSTSERVTVCMLPSPLSAPTVRVRALRFAFVTSLLRDLPGAECLQQQERGVYALALGTGSAVHSVRVSILRRAEGLVLPSDTDAAAKVAVPGWMLGFCNMDFVSCAGEAEIERVSLHVEARLLHAASVDIDDNFGKLLALACLSVPSRVSTYEARTICAADAQFGPGALVLFRCDRERHTGALVFLGSPQADRPLSAARMDLTVPLALLSRHTARLRGQVARQHADDLGVLADLCASLLRSRLDGCLREAPRSSCMSNQSVLAGRSLSELRHPHLPLTIVGYAAASSS